MIRPNKPKQQRKERADKKIRVNVPIEKNHESMLKRLAFACETTKTHIAADIIEIALGTPEFVNFLQQKYGADRYMIIPVKDGSRVFYVSSNGN